MKRVLVIGPGGAGKTTLSQALGRSTGLPVVHLDRHYWQAGWRQPDPTAWRARVENLLRKPEWILTYRSRCHADVMVRLGALDGHADVHVIRSDAEAARFVERVAADRFRDQGRAAPSVTDREDAPAA